MRLILLCGLCALAGSTAFAASPSLGDIQPRGGQRGTEVILSFRGGNLADAQEILIYYPGITVKKIESAAAGEVKATVAIAPDCRLGEHAFRVRTATGLSDLRTFWVGALPIVEEKEPNNDFAAPQPIAMNSTVHGTITGEDVDHFVVECKKGQRLSVEVEGMRLGSGFFDPCVTIYNANRFELAVADDAFITAQDGGASIAIPADGKYIVQVRETSFGGGGNPYRLHVGHFPRPLAMIPAGGKPGETLEVRFQGDPLGEIKQKITLPNEETPHTRIHAQTPEGIHPAGLRVRVNPLPAFIETTNANSLKTALPGTVPGAFHGVISAPGEIDFLKFFAKKGQVFDVACYARRLGSPLDPVMVLEKLNAEGKVEKGIQSADDGAGADSVFRTTIPDDGEYIVHLYDHLRGGGPNHVYRVEISTPQPTASLRLPYVDGNNLANQDRQTWSVPKGGRLAMPLQLGRDNWGGTAGLNIEGLPAGLKVTVDPIDFSLGTIPVILEAAADAPVGGKLTQAKLVPAPNPVAFPSPVHSAVDAMLNRGQNNVIYHSHSTDRLAIAVTEAAPYSIEVVEPKVPLVQNGSMQLKVIAKRSGNFTGPITVFPVISLPGVGISGATTIPEKATECLVPVNAAANAPARKWRLAFMAVANTGAGNVWTGSQLFSLEVASPFVTLAQARTAVEQGAATSVVCKVTTNAPFPGKAKATLVGLPPKVSAQPVEFEHGTAEITFPVTTDKTSPAGKHGPFVQVVIVKDGEPIHHNLGGGELRIDVPIAPKAATAAAPAPAAKPAAPAKPLSRLEQLRKEQEEREKTTAKPAEPKKP